MEHGQLLSGYSLEAPGSNSASATGKTAAVAAVNARMRAGPGLRAATQRVSVQGSCQHGHKRKLTLNWTSPPMDLERSDPDIV